MARQFRLGSAFIRLFVKQDELDSGLNEAKGKVEGFNDSVRGGVKPARDLAGSLSMVVTTVSRALGLIGLIVTGIYAAAKGASALAKAMGSVEKQAARADEAFRKLKASANQDIAAAESPMLSDYEKLQRQINASEDEFIAKRRQASEEIRAAAGRDARFEQATTQKIIDVEDALWKAHLTRREALEQEYERSRGARVKQMLEGLEAARAQAREKEAGEREDEEEALQFRAKEIMDLYAESMQQQEDAKRSIEETIDRISKKILDTARQEAAIRESSYRSISSLNRSLDPGRSASSMSSINTLVRMIAYEARRGDYQ